MPTTTPHRLLLAIALPLAACTAEHVDPDHGLRSISDPDTGGELVDRSREPVAIQVGGNTCDGGSLPQCPTGTTGPSCSYPCDQGVPACTFEYECHGDERIYGVAVSGSHLFPLPASGAPNQVIGALEEWITSHEEDLGLADGLTPQDLLIKPADGFRVKEGLLTTYRLRQFYLASNEPSQIPVIADGGLIVIESNQGGALAVRGTIIDPRVRYDNAQAQATRKLAAASIARHASARTGLPLASIEVGRPTLVAVPSAETIGWYGTASVGLGSIARVVVDADPNELGLLDLMMFTTGEHQGLFDVVPIEVLSRDLGISPWDDPVTTATHDTLSDGSVLLGSIDDVSGDIQMGTSEMFLVDLLGGTYNVSSTSSYAKVLHPNGQFLEPPGAGMWWSPEFQAQHGYHIMSEARRAMNRLARGKWDSAVQLLHPTRSSAYPPGTYSPRVVLGHDYDGGTASGVAFLLDIPEDPEDPGGGWVDGEPLSNALSVWPDVVQRPGQGLQHEPMFATQGVSPSIGVVLHEAGHIWDFGLAAGAPVDYLSCSGVVDTTCDAGTTDEGYPLTETIAQMWAMHAFVESFPDLPHQDCAAQTGLPTGIMQVLSRSVPSTAARVQAEGCMESDEPINVFVSNLDPACLDPQSQTSCDRPDSPWGPDSSYYLPCVCDPSDGYQVFSLLQVWWNALHGQYCEPTHPFACTDFEIVWPPMCDAAGSTVDCATPSEAAGLALTYALRSNPLTYEGLFDSMGRFIACNYGEPAFQLYNQSMCEHQLMPCGEVTPTSCETCGNGIREGTEECDGNDLSIDELGFVATCQTEGYAGGDLGCDTTCHYDVSGCTMPGLDTTAGLPETSTTGTTGTTDDTDDTAGTFTDTDTPGETGGEDGCACTSGSGGSGGGGPTALLLSILWWRRRRRTAALALGSLTLGAACNDRPLEDDATSGAPSSSSSASDDGATTSGSSTGSSAREGWPERWYGTYHQYGVTLGEPITAPFIVTPPLMRFDENGMRFYGFTCDDGQAPVSDYEVEVLPSSAQLSWPPREGEAKVPFGEQVVVFPEDECGLLRFEASSPDAGLAVEYWTLGELCLTDPCGTSPSDDEYQQELCPGAVTACSDL